MSGCFAKYDEYGLRHIPTHYARRERFEELRVLLFDYEWLQSKLDVTDPYALIVDMDYLPDDPDLRLVQSSIRMSANILVNDKTQLAPQLIGRLQSKEAPGIIDLLRSAARHGGGGKPWLRPLKQCLPLGNGSLIASDISYHSGTIKGFVFTPDGSKIISWDNGGLCAWSSDRLEFLGREQVSGKYVCVQAIAPMPDNKRIAYVVDSRRDTIFIWNIETKETNYFQLGLESVSSLAISGDLIITAGGNEPPRIWSISSGELLGFLPYETIPEKIPNEIPNGAHEYTLHGEPKLSESPQIRKIAATPDGTAIISLASETGKSWLSRWSLPERKLIFTQTFEVFDANNIHITPDGNWCITTGDRDVRVFDAYSGELHQVFQEHTDKVLSVAVDDDWIYSISSDDSLIIWDIHSGQCLHAFKNVEARNVAVTPSGLLVMDKHLNHIQLWMRRSFQLLDSTEAGFSTPIDAVAMDAEAALFLVAARDESPVLYSNNSRTIIPIEASVNQLAISYDGQYIFFAVDNAIVIWSIPERRIIGNLGSIGQNAIFLETVNNGNVLVANEGGAISIWQLEEGSRQICIATEQIGNGVEAISPDGQYAICVNSSNVRIYDIKSGNQIREIPAEKETYFVQRDRIVHKVAISGDGSRVAVAKGSWRTRGGSSVFVENMQKDENGSSNDGSEEKARQRETLDIPCETDSVADLAFSYDGKILLICDISGTLTLWNIDTNQILHHYCSSEFVCCDISRDGNLILAGDKEGFIHLLKLESNSSPGDPIEPAAFGFPLFSNKKPELDVAKRGHAEECTSQEENAELDNQKDLTPKQTNQFDNALLRGYKEKPPVKDRSYSIQAYRGIILTDPEFSFLYELEQLLGIPIPIYNGGKTDWGFRVENQHIVEFHCSGKNLPSIPESICELRSLTLLNLKENCICELPKSIGNLQSLTSLDLQSNRIATLPESIGNLQSLTLLNLSENCICELPKSIGNLQSLTSLDLQSNRIVALPESIGNLRSLKKLTLLVNQVQSLPESIGNLDAMEELNLAINLVLSLPKEICRLKNLRYLNLGTNQISSLPEEIGCLGNLQHLDLHSNQISSLPESIGNLQALEELIFNENRLVAVPKSLWIIKSLKKLRLDDNKITSFSEEIGQLRKLTDLNLLGNEITSLPKEVHQALRLLDKNGCRVDLSLMPYKEFSNVFFPIAFNPQRPEIVWWFDLDGNLSEVNLATLQESKHIQISQPGLLLSYFSRHDRLQIIDSSGTFQVYDPGRRISTRKFLYRNKPNQKLAAVKLSQLNQVALIYTNGDHSPATLVLHDPLYSLREVAKTQLGFGYFLNVPLEIDNDGNLITMEGQNPIDLVKLDRESLRVLKRYHGSNSYLITIKLIRDLLFASNSRELLIWNYSSSELLYQSKFGLIDSIDWSPKYNTAFICTRFNLVLLNLETGEFLRAFEKLPDLNSISVSKNGELLFLGREGNGDERNKLKEESPAEINRHIEFLAEKITHGSKEDIPLTFIRRLRKIQIWRIADIIQYCRNKSE
jgi:Leucine-rich repeat (LRR) protein/WD40 repeat protein